VVEAGRRRAAVSRLVCRVVGDRGVVAFQELRGRPACGRPPVATAVASGVTVAARGAQHRSTRPSRANAPTSAGSGVSAKKDGHKPRARILQRTRGKVEILRSDTQSQLARGAAFTHHLKVCGQVGGQPGRVLNRARHAGTASLWPALARRPRDHQEVHAKRDDDKQAPSMLATIHALRSRASAGRHHRRRSWPPAEDIRPVCAR